MWKKDQRIPFDGNQPVIICFHNVEIEDSTCFSFDLAVGKTFNNAVISLIQD